MNMSLVYTSHLKERLEKLNDDNFKIGSLFINFHKWNNSEPTYTIKGKILYKYFIYDLHINITNTSECMNRNIIITDMDDLVSRDIEFYWKTEELKYSNIFYNNDDGVRVNNKEILETLKFITDNI